MKDDEKNVELVDLSIGINRDNEEKQKKKTQKRRVLTVDPCGRSEDDAGDNINKTNAFVISSILPYHDCVKDKKGISTER